MSGNSRFDPLSMALATLEQPAAAPATATAPAEDIPTHAAPTAPAPSRAVGPPAANQRVQLNLRVSTSTREAIHDGWTQVVATYPSPGSMLDALVAAHLHSIVSAARRTDQRAA